MTKIEFKRTPEQIALIKAMASTNKVEAAEAQEAFAAFLGPVVQEVLLQAGFANQIYRDETFDEDDSPSYPVDPIFGQGYGDMSIWSQTVGGGLPTNEVSGLSEIKLRTYELDSAISMDKRYARRARLNVVARYVEFLANQFLVKQERNAFAVLFKLLADATTVTTPGQPAQNHAIRSTTAGTFQVDDVNNLYTLVRRLNAAYTGGTPILTQSRGLTDMYVSPEIKGQIRGFAYNPMNTKSGVTSGTSAAGFTSSTVALPDDVRSEMYKSAGTSEIWGITIHEMLELGTSRKYNDLFDFFAGAKNFSTITGTGSAAFNGATSEILLGIDAGRDAFIRPVATYDENGGQLQTFVDDQFVSRAQKIGFYQTLTEGRVALDKRAVAGLIV
jgi:hypothetical protein